MEYFLISLTAISFLAVLSLVKPIIIYFKDPKQLRRFPNAHPLSGITNLWFAYEAWFGRRYLTLQQKHHANGNTIPVLRIGPNHLSFQTREAIKDIQGHGTVMEKGVHYDLLAGSHRHLADVVDRQDHTRKRKMLASAFAGANLLKYDIVVREKMEEFVRQLDRYCPDRPSENSERNPVLLDYRRWAILFTQEFIAAIGLSSDLGFLRKGDDLSTAERPDGTTYKARYRDSIEGYMHQTCVFSAFPNWYHGLVFLSSRLLPTYRTYSLRAQGFGDIVRHLVRARLTQEKNLELGGLTNRNDLLAALIHDRKFQPLNLEFGEIFAEANVILNAGSDSTGIAMTNVIYSLIQHPHILEKLRKEIDAAIPNIRNTVPSYESLKNLPYLRACIDESMRLNAPSQFSLPRKTPPQGAWVSGYWIAGDTQVTIPTHAVHMDSSIWGDPENFRPERWLENRSGEDLDLKEFFLVFSKGPRGCIGKHITYMEQTVMLAVMVGRYEFGIGEEGFEIRRYETVSTIVERLPLWLERREV